MISVCMAMFNGERFVEAQAVSILGQLDEQDELIIVDDYSADRSVEVVKALNDVRIKLYRNERNIGPIRSFERAISLSSGKYVFLSDQDDIWHPDKVRSICRVFEETDALAVVSDARVTDLNGYTIEESLFSKLRSGPGFFGNLFLRRSGFVGCCMAFRAETKAFLMPFPRGINMHDGWIGLCCSVAGSTYFLHEKLIDYRRHENNVSNTGATRSTVAFKLRIRFIYSWLILLNLPSIVRWRLRQRKYST